MYISLMTEKPVRKSVTRSLICSRMRRTRGPWNWRISGAAFSFRHACLSNSTSVVPVSSVASSSASPLHHPEPDDAISTQRSDLLSRRNKREALEMGGFVTFERKRKARGGNGSGTNGFHLRFVWI